MPARSALLPFLLILLSLDAAVVVALGRGVDPVGLATAEGPGEVGEAIDTAVAVDPGSLDPGWALCQTRFEGKTVTPVSVAVTYLDPGIDDELVPDEVRSWFGPVDGAQVDVYKLELRGGRRRIALELSQGKWPTWQKVAAGHTGTTVCGLVRAALVSADIGRPLPAHEAEPAGHDVDRDTRRDSRRDVDHDFGHDVGHDFGQGFARDVDHDLGQDLGRDTEQAAAFDEADPAEQAGGMERSRHDFEFIYARRPRLYRTVEWVGTLDHALELDTFLALRQWLNRSKP